MTFTIRSLKRCAVLVAAMIYAGQFRAAAADAQESPAERQRQAITTLTSGAPPADKAMACKKLAVCGTTDAVPALAPLLSDEKLASWARIALEVIPGPAADDALGDAMGKLQGKLLVGVINSIGVRRADKLFDKLVEKLKDGDPEVASAAAVALGRIGGAPSARALEPLLSRAPAGVRPAVAEGCILCAEKFLAAGKHADAAKLYDAVRNAKVSKQKTVEATRGAILARRADGVPLLVEQLKSSDKTFFGLGLSAARELPGREVTQALLAEMERATPERQSYFLLVLADRGDAEALAAALKMAKSGTPQQRLTAIGVLDRLNNSAAVPVLLAVATESDAKIAQAAKTTLTKFTGADVDAAVVAMLKQPDENARRAAIELIAQRRVMSAMPDLLKSAEDSNSAVAVASFKALGELAGTDEIPALLKVLVKTQETTAAENALSAISARLTRPVTGNVVIQKAVYGDLPSGPTADVTAKVAELVKTSASVAASNKNFGDPAGGRVKRLRVEYTVNGTPATKTVRENETITFTATAAPPAFVDALCGAMGSAPVPAKLALLGVLRSAGGSKALAAVRAASTDANTEVKESALRTLCDWQTVDALPDVIQISKTATEKKWKILSLRGQLRLIPQQDASADQKLAALKEAMGQIERDEEKRLALAALGDIPTAESLALVMPHLSEGNLKEEASIAAVAIAEKIAGRNPAQVAKAMQQVTTADKKLAQQAKRLLAQTRKAAPQPKKK